MRDIWTDRTAHPKLFLYQHFSLNGDKKDTTTYQLLKPQTKEASLISAFPSPAPPPNPHVQLLNRSCFFCYQNMSWIQSLLSVSTATVWFRPPLFPTWISLANYFISTLNPSKPFSKEKPGCSFKKYKSDWLIWQIRLKLIHFFVLFTSLSTIHLASPTTLQTHKAFSLLHRYRALSPLLLPQPGGPGPLLFSIFSSFLKEIFPC